MASTKTAARSGSVTNHSRRNQPAPSSRAASPISRGIAPSAPSTMRKTTGVVRHASTRMTLAYVAAAPGSRKSTGPAPAAWSTPFT